MAQLRRDRVPQCAVAQIHEQGVQRRVPPVRHDGQPARDLRAGQHRGVRQLTDPIVRHINLIDVSLQGSTPGKVRGKCSLAVYQIDGPDEKLLARLLVYAEDDRGNDRTRFPTRPRGGRRGRGATEARRPPFISTPRSRRLRPRRDVRALGLLPG